MPLPCLAAIHVAGKLSACCGPKQEICHRGRCQECSRGSGHERRPRAGRDISPRAGILQQQAGALPSLKEAATICWRDCKYSVEKKPEVYLVISGRSWNTPLRVWWGYRKQEKCLLIFGSPLKTQVSGAAGKEDRRRFYHGFQKGIPVKTSANEKPQIRFWMWICLSWAHDSSTGLFAWIFGIGRTAIQTWTVAINKCQWDHCWSYVHVLDKPWSSSPLQTPSSSPRQQHYNETSGPKSEWNLKLTLMPAGGYNLPQWVSDWQGRKPFSRWRGRKAQSTSPSAVPGSAVRLFPPQPPSAACRAGTVSPCLHHLSQKNPVYPSTKSWSCSSLPFLAASGPLILY